LESVNCFICDTKPSESLIFIIMIYHLELTPKSFYRETLSEVVSQKCDFLIETITIKTYIINSRFI
jgi:hypothetical protein